MDGDTTQNIVDEHRKMIVLTGNVSEFQIENLQKWPYLVFGEDLEKVSIEYNFVQGEGEEGDLYAGSVSFDFTFSTEPKLVEHSLNLLKHWTQYLFWEDTVVKFSREGKTWPKKLK